MDKRTTISPFLGLLVAVALGSVLVDAQRGLNSLKSGGGGDSVQGKGTLPQRPKDTTAYDPKQAKIMKQINKVNEDGSYTFGYEADDGSFRVETRSKDGVVKGKYGYVDATGQLKVMEYTAGEKTGSEEEGVEEASTSAPLRRQQGPVVRYLGSPSSALPQQVRVLKQRRGDQYTAAQTDARKVTVPQEPESSNGGNNSVEEDEEAKEGGGESEGGDAGVNQLKGEDVGDVSIDEINNGQYFRALPPQSQPQPGGPKPPTQQGGGGESPRYVPTHQFGPGPQGQGQAQGHPQYPASSYPYNSPFLQQGSPPQYPSNFPPQGSRQPAFYQGQPQQQQPQQAAGPYDDYESGFALAGGRPQFSYPQTPAFPQPSRSQGGRSQAGPPNVQVQYRGSPSAPRQPQQIQPQSPYFNPYANFPPSSSFPTRAGPSRPQSSFVPTSGQQGEQQEQYFPNLALDGFSEDADEDGFVDEAPGGNSLGRGRETTAAQEKQGVVAVKAVGEGRREPAGQGQGVSELYRPQALGPQGLLQGGQISIGQGQGQGPSSGSQGGSRRPLPGPGGPPPPPGFFGQGPSEFPQLTEEQYLQIFGGGGQGQGGQPSIRPGSSSSGPQQGQQNQGFPPGFHPQQFGPFPSSPPQQQGGFGGGPGPQGSHPSLQRPSQQQNPQFQGQYDPSSDSEQQGLAGIPPQFLPQPGDYNQFLGPQQGQFNPQQQSFPPPQSSNGGGSGRPSQGSNGGGGSALQSAGFPFDFSPFGNQGGFQGGPPPFPGGGGPGGFPGLGPSAFPPQNGYHPAGTLSPQEFAAIQQQQQQLQGSPSPSSDGVNGGSPTPASIQGFVPGRFPSSQVPQGGSPYLSSQGGSPYGRPVGVQLGGGAPRPVQPASSSGSNGGVQRVVSYRGPNPTASN